MLYLVPIDFIHSFHIIQGSNIMTRYLAFLLPIFLIFIGFSNVHGKNTNAVLVVHANTITPEVTVTPKPTTTPTPTPTPIVAPTPTPTPQTQVLINNGNGFFVTPLEVEEIDNVGEENDEVGVYLTTPASELVIAKDDGTHIALGENTLVSNSPPVEEDNVEIDTTNLVTGTMAAATTPSCNKEYRVNTPLATLVVPKACNKRAANERVEFHSVYEQVGDTGQLTITVNKGSLEVIERDNTRTAMTAGQVKVIGNIVNRVTWALPVDGDAIYGNKVNLLAWTKHHLASSYLLEYNLPGAVFAENNPLANEYPTFIRVYPKGSVDADGNPRPFTYEEAVPGILTMELRLGDGGGVKVEARLFAMDENDNFLGSSVASDKGTYTWK